MMKKVAIPYLTTLLVALLLPALVQAGDKGSKFTGTYKYAGGSKEKKEIDKEIDKATLRMNIAIRTIARRRLKNALPIQTITLKVGGGKVYIKAGELQVETKDDGTSKTVKDSRGDSLRVSHDVDDDEIIQRIKGKNRKSKIKYTLSSDGKTLKIKSRTEGDDFGTIKYEVTYKRI